MRTTLHYKRQHENADPAWGVHLIFTPHGALVASTNNEEDARDIVRCVNTHAQLVEALEAAERLIREALPKFNWGASALDANAIRLLNEVPGTVRAALSAAKET